jgi:tRNA-specific 2-thiouridylase
VLGDAHELDQNIMTVGGLNMVKYDAIPEGMEATTKIRYKDAGALSHLHLDGDKVNVHFYEDVKGIAPGQSAVFYEGDDVIAGGIIRAGMRG